MKDSFSIYQNDQDMDEAVKNLPNSVEDMYAKILKKRIFHHEHKNNKVKARLIFILLVYSIRPLTLGELACAVSLPEPRKVLEICTSSLVSVSSALPRQQHKGNFSEDDIVKFDHFSVKEYLTSEHLLESRETAYFYTTPLVAHLEIAQVSVSHLLDTNNINFIATRKFRASSRKDFDAKSGQGVEVKSKNMGTELSEAHEADILSQESWPCRPALWPEFPLLDYSMYWFRHVQQADAIEEVIDRDSFKQSLEARSAATQPDPEDLRSQIHRLFCGRPYLQSFENWWSLLRAKFLLVPRRKRYSRVPSSLWMASLFDLSDNVRRLLRSGVSVDGDSDDAGSMTTTCKPVLIAAFAGSAKVLHLLLDNDATLEQKELDLVVQENDRHGAVILSTILEARPHLAIEDSTVIASAENIYSAEMLNYILAIPDLDILTEALLMEIVKKTPCLDFREETVQMIMRLGDDIGCSSRYMLKAFICDSSCGLTLSLVIDRYKPPASMSQEVVKWVIETRFPGDFGLGKVLWYYRGTPIDLSHDSLVKAAGLHEGALLYQGILRANENIVITEDMMDSIATSVIGIAITGVLMDHGLCGTTDLVDDRSSGFYEITRTSEKHMETCKIRISKETLEAAARWEPDTIGYLQAHAKPQVTFTKEILQTASSSSKQRISTSSMKVLLTVDDFIPRSEH